MDIKKAVSLFDGCGMAWQSLKNAGVEFDVGYSSEIEKNAIKVLSDNHPEINHLGDVNNWHQWDIDWSEVDLIIGGSPCQGFSNIGKKGGTKAMIEGVETVISTREQYIMAKDSGAEFLSHSHLFWEFVLILDNALSFNPDVKFMLENVKMSQHNLDLISDAIGVDGFFIDSRDCSPCARPRWYWSNFPIDYPKPSNVDFISCIDTGFSENVMSDGWHDWWEKNKEFQIKKSYSALMKPGDKGITMTTRQYASWNGNFIEVSPGVIRKPNKQELAKLCGLPINYFKSVSQRQAEILSGNGWDCNVTTHIFKELTADQLRGK